MRADEAEQSRGDMFHKNCVVFRHVFHSEDKRVDKKYLTWHKEFNREVNEMTIQKQFAKEMNMKLESHELRIAPQPNQLNLFSFLGTSKQAGSYTNYPGNSDEIEQMIDNNRDIVENKVAAADETVFMIKNALQALENQQIDEDHKRQLSETLKANQGLLEQLATNLRHLDKIYESLIIEPGVILIDDGEREDPESFHLVIDPPTSISQEEKANIEQNWKTLLEKYEAAVNTHITLTNLPVG